MRRFSALFFACDFSITAGYSSKSAEDLVMHCSDTVFFKDT